MAQNTDNFETDQIPSSSKARMYNFEQVYETNEEFKQQNGAKSSQFEPINLNKQFFSFNPYSEEIMQESFMQGNSSQRRNIINENSPETNDYSDSSDGDY